MAEAGAAKLCIICGQDCSRRARTKDAQGNYVCADCVRRAAEVQAQREKARAAAQEPERVVGPTVSTLSAISPPTGVDPVLDALLERSTPVAACPECWHAIPVNSKLCTHCGLDMSSGKRFKTSVKKRS